MIKKENYSWIPDEMFESFETFANDLIGELDRNINEILLKIGLEPLNDNYKKDLNND